jgi:hypothetical protein
MEKISRIIPPSARTRSYDVSRSQPARPGAPQMGRPESMNVIEDRLTLSEQFLQPIMSGETLRPTPAVNQETYGPKENIKSQMVKDLTQKFFLKETPKDIAKETDEAHSEELATRVQSSTGSMVKPDSSKDVSL